MKILIFVKFWSSNVKRKRGKQLKDGIHFAFNLNIYFFTLFEIGDWGLGGNVTHSCI
jgi:hypothetical protein